MAAHSVFGVSAGAISSGATTTLTSSETTHSGGVISSVFAPQLERNREIEKIAERSTGVVFFINNRY